MSLEGVGWGGGGGRVVMEWGVMGAWGGMEGTRILGSGGGGDGGRWRTERQGGGERACQC